MCEGKGNRSTTKNTPNSSTCTRDLLKNVHVTYDDVSTNVSTAPETEGEKNEKIVLQTMEKLEQRNQKNKKNKTKIRALGAAHRLLFDGPLRYQHQASMPAKRQHIRAIIKGSSGTVSIAGGQIHQTSKYRQQLKGKIGIYGSMGHLNFIQKRRPLSAPKKRRGTKNGNDGTTDRRMHRPQSAMNVSSITSITSSISEASMKSLKSTCSQLTPASQRSWTPPRKRPQSAALRRSATKQQLRRPQSAAAVRRKLVHFE